MGHKCTCHWTIWYTGMYGCNYTHTTHTSENIEPIGLEHRTVRDNPDTIICMKQDSYGSDTQPCPMPNGVDSQKHTGGTVCYITKLNGHSTITRTEGTYQNTPGDLLPTLSLNVVISLCIVLINNMLPEQQKYIRPLPVYCQYTFLCLCVSVCVCTHTKWL